MNMREPTTAWDRAPTDAELNAYYGKDKSTRVHDEIVETLTQSIRKVGHAGLSVPFVSHRGTDYGVLRQYPLVEVVRDYSSNEGPEAALMAVMERSDCPLVAAYREALAKAYSDSWADDVEALEDES
jgi:hypothetical protein